MVMHVGRTLRRAARHVLGQRQVADDADRRAAARRSPDTAASTAAAPPMSDFIVSIDFGGLSDSPPESNVMPLPTSTTVLAASAGCGVYASRASRGGCTEPWPTPGDAAVAAARRAPSRPGPRRPARRRPRPVPPPRRAWPGTRSDGPVLTRSRASVMASASARRAGCGALGVGRRARISAGGGGCWPGTGRTSSRRAARRARPPRPPRRRVRAVRARPAALACRCR